MNGNARVFALLLTLASACGGPGKHPEHRGKPTPEPAFHVGTISWRDYNRLEARSLRRRNDPALEKIHSDLFELLSAHLVELGCLPVENREAAMRAYRGDEIQLLVPDSFPTPTIDGVTFTRIEGDERQRLSDQAARDCRARLFLYVGSQGGIIELPNAPEVPAIAVGCSFAPSEQGILRKDYPAWAKRGLIGYQGPSGQWEILQTPRHFYSERGREQRAHDGC